MKVLDQDKVERYEASIYQSLLAMDPLVVPATIFHLRGDIAYGVGSQEWRAALGQAIERFEARGK